MGKYSDLLLGGQQTPVGGGKYSSALLGQPQQAAAPQPPETSNIGDFLRGAGDVALFSGADEAEAAFRSMFGERTYAQELEQARAKHEAAGAAYYPGMAAGMAVPGLGAAGTIYKGVQALQAAAKLGPKAAKWAGGGIAALTGGIEGAISAFGAGEGGPGEEGGIEERLSGVPVGAVAGAALAPAGQAIAGGLSKFAQRRLAKDINRLDPTKTSALQQKAQAQGIQLTPAEATNLPSLKAQQKALGNLPQSSDDLADFYAGRAEEQIEPAVNKLLEDFSPISGADIAGIRGRAAAQGAMDTVAANRAAKAAPVYQEAFRQAPQVETTPILNHINKRIPLFPQTGEVRKQLTKAMNLLMKSDTATPTFRQGRQVPGPATPDRLVPETRLENLHSAKMEIDQMINAADADKKLGPVVRRELTEVRGMLKGEMDDASSTYEAATNIFSDMVPGVERVREGVTGIIANLSDTNARLAASKLFNPETSSPMLAREAKQLLSKQDPEAWQGLKRAWLEDRWLKAGNETLAGGPKVNRGALFRKALLGDQKQKRILQETLEPEEFTALTDLSEVLEASGRVKSVGSDTAWNQELMRTERAMASSPLSRTMKLMNPDGLKEIAERWDEKRFADRAQDLVKIVTSPQGVEMMRELKRLPARAIFKRSVIGQALAAGGIAAINQDTNP